MNKSKKGHKMSILISEKHNEDWWFVRKPLTSELGWVPSQYLMEPDKYTQYVQDRLNEKIDKIPIFESMFLFLLYSHFQCLLKPLIILFFTSFYRTRTG